MARPTAAAMAVRLGPPSMPTPAAWLMTARSYSERGSLRRRSFSEAPDDLTRPAPSPFGGHTLVAGGGALWSPKLDQVLDREAGIAEDPDPLPEQGTSLMAGTASACLRGPACGPAGTWRPSSLCRRTAARPSPTSWNGSWRGGPTPA